MGDLIGQHLAHFRIVEKLGQGGMGVVYKAIDEKLRRTVALKVLPADFAGDEERRRRFVREARSAAAVAHASIAVVYDVGEASGRIYIAMELVEGLTLREHLERARISIGEALVLARDIARGLAKAHEKGIVHRDLKPDNVMVNGDQGVKILDFGLAKVREDPERMSKSVLEGAKTASHVTQEGVVLGTPGYMSPEQTTGKPVGTRSDVFAFGVVLYEMVTGTRPFEGDSPMEIAIAITRDVPERASTRNDAVSPALERIIDKCLAKRPEERYPTARELLADLEAIIVTGSGKSDLSKGRDEAPRKRSRGRFLIAAIAVAGVVAVPLALRSSSAPEHSATPPSVSIAPVTSTASSAPSLAVGRVTDAPLPTSTSAEALAAYKAGLQSFRDGSRSAQSSFELALKLDPTLTAAHLRLALASLSNVTSPSVVARAREHQKAATAGRAALSPRDQILLEAIEPMFRQTFQPMEADRLLAGALARMPDDAEVLYCLGVARFWRGEIEGAISALRRATEIDRSFGTAWYRLALALTTGDRLEEATTALETCRAALPGATQCVMGLAVIATHVGQCAVAAERFRDLIVADPADPFFQVGHAMSLFALGRPDEAVQATLQQAARLWPEKERIRASLEYGGYQLDVLRGDFASAERKLRQLESLLDVDAARSTRLELGLQILYVVSEQGRADEAGRTAAAYLRASDAWAPDPREPEGAYIAVLAFEKRAGVLTGAAFAAQRDAWLAQRKARLVAMTGGARGIDGGMAWIDAFAAPAETREEADEALARLPEYLPLPGRYRRQANDDSSVGRTFVLAGKPEAARPYLEHGTSLCGVFDQPVDQVRASYWLGRALEQTGETERACAAYGVVIARWGHAKPKSVTAELARQRRSALGCK